MTTAYLSSGNFPAASKAAANTLAAELESLFSSDFTGNMFAMLAGYQRILADNRQRFTLFPEGSHWFDQLLALPECSYSE